MKPEQIITPAMIDAPRDFLLGLNLGCNNLSTMRTHLDNCCCDYSYWPEWAKTETGHITKAGQAILIYTMMEHARELEELKTPAERLGYKVGDMFVTSANVYHSLTAGRIVSLYEDDGSDWPLFKIEDGLGCEFNCCAGQPGQFVQLDRVKPL